MFVKEVTLIMFVRLTIEMFFKEVTLIMFVNMTIAVCQSGKIDNVCQYDNSFLSWLTRLKFRIGCC